ncbi:uncharacterized protein LOC121861157 [Homarus americanus]|nr:uncharacterized protein LOC121861157 [Homarus americanus]
MVFLSLHNLTVASGAATQPWDATPPHTSLTAETSRSLSPNLFGFETILTGLVYLSFGIFLYQMIQRAVGARVLGSSTSSSYSSSGRSMEDEVPNYQIISLLDSLERIPNVAAEVVLMGMKGKEVLARRPSCLPLFLCRLNLQHQQQPHEDGASSFRRSAIVAVSSAMSMWAGVQQPDLLFPASVASWTGANGLSCHRASTTCHDASDYASTLLKLQNDQRPLSTETTGPTDRWP